jgi:hypothetical protein
MRWRHTAGRNNRSVVVGAALVGFGVVLAVVLERVGVILDLVPRMAGSGAELLHLVPRRRALAGGRLLLARLLRLLDALRHLVRDARRRRRPARPHDEAADAASRHWEAHAAAGDLLLPCCEQVGGREGGRGGEGQRRRHFCAAKLVLGVCSACVLSRRTHCTRRCVCTGEVYIALVRPLGTPVSYRLSARGCEPRRLR